MDSTKAGSRIRRVFRVIDPRGAISLLAAVPGSRMLPFSRFIVRLGSFGGVGATGFALDVACYVGLQWLGMDHRVARAVAFWPAATWNWFLNRKVTFFGRAPDPHAHQWARFVAGSLVGLTVNAGSYSLLTTFVEYFIDRRWLALLLGVALGGLVNFALATKYVYRRESVQQS